MVDLLLDTCVISEVLHPRGAPRVKTFVAELDPARTFVSVLTVGEILRGLSNLGDGQRKRAITSWLDETEKEFERLLLGVSYEIARTWGEITDNARTRGETIPAVDGLIVATAMVHDLAVVTRNVKDFEVTGVQIVNPWDEA